MAEVVSLAPFEVFMPLVAFFFVFVLVYALLNKSKVVEGGVAVFISFTMAIMFIVNTQLVDFVKISASWIVVFIVCLFMILLITGISETPELVTKNKGVGVFLILIVLILFAVSSSYVFNWVINWQTLQDWFDEEWFGTVALLIVAGIVSYMLTKTVTVAKGKDK